MKRLAHILLIIITSCAASSCRKDDFDNYWYMVSCIYDGTPCSRNFRQASFLGWTNNPGDVLKIDRKDNTTFIYSEFFEWSDTPNPNFLYGCISLIDKEHPTIPDQARYELKKGLIVSRIQQESPPFTDNAILAYSPYHGRKDIEIIDGWCTLEKVIRKKTNFRGMKICFEVRWRLPENGEEHFISNGELLISHRIIKASI